MIRTTSCVTVHCDPCGADAEIDDMVVHFTNQADAENSLQGHGWRFLPAGEVLCRDCANARDCELHGHDWHAWRACGCVGRIPSHLNFASVAAILAGECAAEYRACERCGATEDRQAQTLTAGGEA